MARTKGIAIEATGAPALERVRLELPVFEDEVRGAGPVKALDRLLGGALAGAIRAERFEGKPGSNPEELIGAAHAACFTMALSLILGEAKLTAEQMETKADVTIEKVGDGFSITSVHLSLQAKIPGADAAKFQELAGMAKAGCPVSKLLNTKISLDAKLL